MIDTGLEIPKDVEQALQGLTDKETRIMLRKAMQESTGPGGVLEKHWQEGQSKWDRPEGKEGPLFYETGNALKALTDKRSKFRKTRVSKQRKSGEWRATVGLRKMDNGKNAYAIAQKGGFGGIDKNGKRVSIKPRLVTANLPGDERIVTPHVINAVTAALKEKGLL